MAVGVLFIFLSSISAAETSSRNCIAIVKRVLNRVENRVDAQIVNRVSFEVVHMFRKTKVKRRSYIPFVETNLTPTYSIYNFYGHKVIVNGITFTIRMNRFEKRDRSEHFRLEILALHELDAEGQPLVDGANVGLSSQFLSFTVGILKSLEGVIEAEPKLDTIEVVANTVNPAVGNFFSKRGFEYEEFIMDREPLIGTPRPPSPAWSGVIRFKREDFQTQ